MTVEAISEVYAIAREAFAGGQRGFQFQSYPFRMTAENLAKHRADPNMAFWRNLKEGADHFEVLREEPRVSVADLRYHFGPEHPAVAQKRAEDEQKVAELVGTGVPAVRTVYDDGGGHRSFHKAMAATTAGDSGSTFAFLDSRTSRNLGDVSRPEALAAGPREIPVETPAKAKERASKSAVQAASAAPVANPAIATPAETKSFYERALGLFGKSEQPAAPAVEAVTPSAAVPAPPRRGASTTAPARPQATAPTPDRRASLNTSAMPGSQPVLPAGNTGFGRLN